MKILLRGKNILFPGACALCGAGLIEPEEICFSLCEECKNKFIPSDSEKCVKCGKPLISEEQTCLPCREKGELSLDRLWVLYPYTGKYRNILSAYKFGKNLSLAGFFASQAAELAANEPLLKDTVIVPVPPRPGKIKHSGWDQVDYLVKVIEKRFKRNVSRVLKRKKSKVQKELNRSERLENLKGRIYTNGIAPINALIIDDVITTGSTLEVCAKALKDAGAEKVYGICLFYD